MEFGAELEAQGDLTPSSLRQGQWASALTPEPGSLGPVVPKSGVCGHWAPA